MSGFRCILCTEMDIGKESRNLIYHYPDDLFIGGSGNEDRWSYNGIN